MREEWRAQKEVMAAVTRVLAGHVGRERVISRAGLVAAVRRDLGTRVSERAVRAAVNGLRKRGVLICSAGGRGGGYWLAKDRVEAMDFLAREVRPRIRDLAEVDRAMTRAVVHRWGQPGLFDGVTSDGWREAVR